MGATAGAIRAGRAFVELFADDSKMQAVLKRAQVRLLSFSDFVRTVGLRMASLGTLMTIPFVKATSDYAKFDDQMREVAGVVSATNDELVMLTKTARRLAQQRGTSFLATDIGALMAELGRSGFASEAVNRMTRSVLLLSRATKTELPISAKITGSTLRQFNLGAEQAGHVTDLLAKTANASATSVSSLGDSLKYAGKPLADLGYSLEESLSIIGVLGNLGIVGEEAGTVTRRLSTEMAALAPELEQILGVQFRDGRGNALKMIDVLERVSESTSKLGSSERFAKLHKAFGLLGITGSIALGSSAKSAREFQKALANVTGYSEQAAKRMDEGIGGSLRQMWASLFEDELSVGNALEKHLIPIIDRVTLSFRQLAHWVQENPITVQEIAKGAVAIAASGTALMGIGVAGGIAALNLRGIGYALHAAVTPAKLLSNALGGVLSMAYRAEKMGTSWAGMLMTGVMGGRGARGQGRDGKIRKSDVGKSIETVSRRRGSRSDPLLKAAGKSLGDAGGLAWRGLIDASAGMRARIRPVAMPNLGLSGMFGRAAGIAGSASAGLPSRRSLRTTLQSALTFYRQFEQRLNLRAGTLVSDVRALTEREVNGAAFGTRTGGMLGRIRGVFFRGRSSIGLAQGLADQTTRDHELGHAVDARLGGGSYGSRDGVGLPGRMRGSLSRLLRIRRPDRMTDQRQAYLNDPAEQFARFFAGMSLPMQTAVARPQSNAGIRERLGQLGRFLKIRSTRGVVHAGRGFDAVEGNLIRMGNLFSETMTRARRRTGVMVGRGLQLPGRMFGASYRGAMGAMAGSRGLMGGLGTAMSVLPTRFLAHGMKGMDVSLKLAAGGFATVATSAKLARAALGAGWSASFTLMRAGFRASVAAMQGFVANAPKLWNMAKGFGSMSIAAMKATVAISKLMVLKGIAGLASGVSMLLSPMGLMVGAGVLVAANWDKIKGAISGVVSSAPGALSGMWGRIKSDAMPTLLGIKDTALTSFGAISEAVQAGDIPAAMQILWGGIRAIWQEGFGYLRLKWFDLTNWAGDAFNGVLQICASAAGSIANSLDSGLFDWFGIRLNDVTGAFSTAWGWIAEKSGAVADWVSTQWNAVFGGMGEAGQSLSDIIWNSFEWMRKKIAQTILLMLNAAKTISDLDPTGMTSKMLGLKGFNIEDARKSLDDQFSDRDRQRKKVASGDDPAMQARVEAAKKKVEDLEKQRQDNALAARADRAQIEEDLRKKLELEKANLDAVIVETKKKRELRDATEAAANAGRDDGAKAGSAGGGQPTMPSGLTRQQQRSWMLKEQIRQRNEFFAAKKAAAEEKKAADREARAEKKRKIEEQRVAKAAGGLLPNRELFFQQGPQFFDDEEQAQHDAAIEDARQARMDLKNRVPNLQALRMGGLRPETSPTPGSQIKVDQSAVTAKLDETNKYLVGVIDSIRRLNGNFV